MIIFPAIDIRNGKCVRLYKGNFDEETVYSDKPYEMAKKWQDAGAEFLHIVDLDGARYGNRENEDEILKIIKTVAIPIQLGGGIRDMESISFYLNAGIERVILGTSAVLDLEFLKKAVDKYGDKIVVGIDAKDNYVATHGWEEVSGINAIEFAKKLKNIGVTTIVYTDIKTDGTLLGPNIDAMREMVEESKLSVIASGGVASHLDIVNLKKTNAHGVIVGKALYTNNVSLKEAIALAK